MNLNYFFRTCFLLILMLAIAPVKAGNTVFSDGKYQQSYFDDSLVLRFKLVTGAGYPEVLWHGYNPSKTKSIAAFKLIEYYQWLLQKKLVMSFQVKPSGVEDQARLIFSYYQSGSHQAVIKIIYTIPNGSIVAGPHLVQHALATRLHRMSDEVFFIDPLQQAILDNNKALIEDRKPENENFGWVGIHQHHSVCSLEKQDNHLKIVARIPDLSGGIESALYHLSFHLRRPAQEHLVEEVIPHSDIVQVQGASQGYFESSNTADLGYVVNYLESLPSVPSPQNMALMDDVSNVPPAVRFGAGVSYVSHNEACEQRGRCEAAMELLHRAAGFAALTIFMLMFSYVLSGAG